MWDHQGNWHDSNWWQQNNPNYATQYHPEWAANHPAWANGHPPGDGDFDENHHWRAREWWMNHHRDWVAQHHPDWVAANRGNPNEGMHQNHEHHY